MPYAPNYMMDEEQKKKAAEGGGVNISGVGGSDFSTGVPGQEAGTASKDKKSSGQYANIQSYLDANKYQADTMGSTIAGNVENKAQDATNKINSFQAKAPEVKAYDPNEAYKNLGSLTDEQKNTYRAQKDTGGYSGPATVDQVEGYGDTQKAASEASGLVKNTGNEYGQQQLLKDTYKRPDYTAGQNKLDQVLLQNSPGSKAALQNVSNKYAGLDSLFNDANTKVGDSIKTATGQALANKQAITTAEKDQWDNLINPISERAKQQTAANQALIDRANADFYDGNDTLSEELLAQLGLSEGQNLFNLNLDLGGYLKTDATPVGMDNAATADERSKYQALADLVSDKSRTQLTKDGKAINAISLNKDKFNKDYQAQSDAYNSAYAQSTADAQGKMDAYLQQGLANMATPWGEAMYGIDGALIRNRGDLERDAQSRYPGYLAELQAAANNQFKIDRKIKKG